jgi:hypothetical protein
MADLKVQPHSPFFNPEITRYVDKAAVDSAQNIDTAVDQHEEKIASQTTSTATLDRTPDTAVTRDAKVDALHNDANEHLNTAERNLKRYGNALVNPADRQATQANLQAALDKANTALEATKAIASTKNSTVTREEHTRNALASGLALSNAISVQTKKLDSIERQLQYYTDQAEKQNFELNQIQDLLTALTPITGDKLDVSKDLDGQDHSKLRFMIDYAKARGVLFKTYGWESEKERTGLIKALETKVTALQTGSKKIDLQLQQTYENFSTSVMWISTSIKMLFELLKNIISNIK